MCLYWYLPDPKPITRAYTAGVVCVYDMHGGDIHKWLVRACTPSFQFLVLTSSMGCRSVFIHSGWRIGRQFWPLSSNLRLTTAPSQAVIPGEDAPAYGLDLQELDQVALFLLSYIPIVRPLRWRLWSLTRFLSSRSPSSSCSHSDTNWSTRPEWSDWMKCPFPRKGCQISKKRDQKVVGFAGYLLFTRKTCLRISDAKRTTTLPSYFCFSLPCLFGLLVSLTTWDVDPKMAI